MIQIVVQTTAVYERTVTPSNIRESRTMKKIFSLYQKGVET